MYSDPTRALSRVLGYTGPSRRNVDASGQNGRSSDSYLDRRRGTGARHRLRRWEGGRRLVLEQRRLGHAFGWNGSVHERRGLALGRRFRERWYHIVGRCRDGRLVGRVLGSDGREHRIRSQRGYRWLLLWRWAPHRRQARDGGGVLCCRQPCFGGGLVWRWSIGGKRPGSRGSPCHGRRGRRRNGLQRGRWWQWWFGHSRGRHRR